MGFAEDKVFDYLVNNLHMMMDINVEEMLDHLRGVFTTSTGEQLERHLDRRGNSRTVYHFLLDLKKRDDWVNNFLRALWACKHRELFHNLQAEYRSHTPKRVWEPDPPPYSLPTTSPNQYDLPRPDSPHRCASLPAQVNHNPLQQSPDPPMAIKQASTWSNQPQEGNGPSSLPYAFASQRSPAPALAHPASLPDQVDAGTSDGDISKTPVPESLPIQPEQFVKSDARLSCEATDHEYSSAASPVSLERDFTTTQPVIEISKNREVVQSGEQNTSMVNHQRKNADNELPSTSIYQDVASPRSNAPNPSCSSASSMHEAHKAGAVPQQGELPSYSQGTSNFPASQNFTTNNTNRSYSVESVQRPVTASPSQRQSVSSLESGATAGSEHQSREQSTNHSVTASPSQSQSVSSLESGATAGSEHQSREQSTNHSSAQLSSCRPTEDDSRWNLSKPGVLMSTAGFADVTGETNEVAPLSRVPELEISDDESSNAPSPGSSKLPAVSRSKGSPISQEVKTTSTSKKVGLRISPKKSPEENEEPRGVSSSAYSRPLNASLSQEPEENSFEISRYRVDFNESPSVILMAKNNVPINNVPIKSTRDTPRSMETSDRVASQEEEKLGKSSLHDPLVITLSAAVVCLSLYIIWLKHKN